MRCRRCGSKNDRKAQFCEKCGAQLRPIIKQTFQYRPEHAPEKQPEKPPEPSWEQSREKVTASVKAVLSLILGILGIATCLGVLVGIPAIILGISAKRDIRNNPGMLTGNGKATAGIVLGLCSFLIPLALSMLAVPNFTGAQVKSKASRVKSDLRIMRTALESYFVDNNVYPAFGTGSRSVNAGLLSHNDPEYKFPSFHIPTRSMGNLTTPVSYINRLLVDQFAPKPGMIYGYYYNKSVGWILISAGPDRKYDIDPANDFYYEGSDLSPVFIEKIYDPTNGTKSSGDIVRTKSGEITGW